MKNLCIILLMLASTASYAQKTIAIGGQIGIGQGNMKLHGVDIPFLNTQSTSHYSIGINTIIPLHKGLSARSELLFSQSGFHITEGVTPETAQIPIPIGASVRLKASYIEMPLMLEYSIPAGSVDFFIHSGVSIDRLQSAKLRTSARVIVEIPVFETDLTGAGTINRWSSSALVGAGLSIPAGNNGSFMIQARYQHGLGGQLDLPIDGVGLRRRGAQISAGYQWKF